METIIKPKPKWALLDLVEIWRYRELFWIFAWRDIKVRYKQTIFGAGWAIFQPLFSMFIFTIFFGQLAQIPSGNLPYSLFVLIGLVFWGFFSGVLSNASNSLVENDQIIKKVYFPKLILPLSSILTNMIDFSISFTLLLAVSVFLHYPPNITIALIIVLGLIIGSLGAGGLGLFLAAVNVKYRDVRYILPFFIQMMIFLTPVIYPVTIIRPSFRILMALNPMTGIIEAARVSFGGSYSLDFTMLGVSFVSAAILFILGLIYFRSTERFFADIA